MSTRTSPVAQFSKVKKPVISDRSSNSTKSRSSCLAELCAEFVSGWVGGACGVATTHPIDSVKTSKQYYARITKKDLNYFEIIKHTYSKHGTAGFYRGIIPPTVLRGFGVAANRTGYNVGLMLFEGEQIEGTWRTAVVGAIAGLFTGVTDMPVYLLKCRSQVKMGLSQETFRHYAEMTRRIWKYEGIRAFTNGLIPQLFFTCISFSLFYAIYDNMIANGFSVIIAGMAAGTFSWPPCVPFDSLRVRMQCQPYNVPLSVVAGEMWRQPIRLWFAGNGASMLRAAPRWGITMLAIEKCNEALKQRF